MGTNRQKFYCLCVVMLLSFSGCQEKEATVLYESDVEIEEQTEMKIEKDSPDSVIFVYVCGEVVCPGVYEFVEGARIADAIELAGGMTDAAATTYLNQAAVLEDGQKIYVPTQEEEEQRYLSETGKINLNTAGIQELTTLSGVGESKAKAIIRYREEQGGFKSIDEVMNIEGIKEGVFQQIKDSIVVE